MGSQQDEPLSKTSRSPDRHREFAQTDDSQCQDVHRLMNTSTDTGTPKNVKRSREPKPNPVSQPLDVDSSQLKTGSSTILAIRSGDPIVWYARFY